MQFGFVNLKLADAPQGGKQVVPKGPGGSYLIVHFQPQHIYEEALLENPTPPPPLKKPVDARIAGASRVVLKVPAEKTPIPFTGDGLLAALGGLEMNVAPNALPPDPPGTLEPWRPGPLVKFSGLHAIRAASRSRNLFALHRQGALASVITDAEMVGARQPAAGGTEALHLAPEAGAKKGIDASVIAARPWLYPRPQLPSDGETSLELPFRLLLSPNRRGGWAHNTSADEGLKLGRYELWHTRLGVRNEATGNVSEDSSYLRAIRAIWTRDWPPNIQFDPKDYTGGVPTTESAFGGAPTSLVPVDRAEIVQLSSNFADFPFYTPKAVDVNRLMLTSLGGWLDLHGDFGINSPLNLIAWDHKAALGRDYYVKVQRKGRLYPWGHFAIKIEITERKFRLPDVTAAYLWKRTFILIREPVRTYPDGWRKMPFQSVRVKTLVTPDLWNVPSGDVATQIQVDASTPFRFKMEGVDREGNVVKFDAVASWAPMQGSVIQLADAQAAATIYDGYGSARTSGFDGQRFAYAPSRKSDDTTYETQEILFDGILSGNEPPGVTIPSMGFPYAPGVGNAKINVEAIRHLVGQGAPTPFEYHLTYLQSGLPAPGSTGAHPNKGEILFKLLSTTPPIKLDFTKKSDASGGFLAPSLDISGISRKVGPVCGSADLSEIASNSFNPSQFLSSIDAMIFGVIPLKNIIATVSDAAGGLDKAPNFLTQAVDAVTGFLEDIETLKARLAEVGDTSGAQAKIDEITASVDTLVGAPDVTSAVNAAKTLLTQLDGLLNTVIGNVDGLPGSILTAVKEDIRRRATSVKERIAAVQDGLTAFATGLEMAKDLTVRLEWRAPLQQDPLGFFVPDPTTGGFLLAVEARAKQVGDKPAGVDVVAGIENFDVNVFGTGAKLVSIRFKRLLFKVESGKKPDVDVLMDGPVGFDGILAFVETLSQLIPTGGFSDPPAIEVDTEGIRSGFNVPIPSIAVGVFSLQNISLGCGFEIPFIGNPLNVRFNFCTREEPFILTVMAIGGGGFFGMKVSPKGLLLLEAALEARAQLSIDFGVASGSVSIAVGVYFRLEGDQGSLTGYIKIQGNVDVLGLITASITLALELTYEFASGKLVGRATLTIEISIAFFSTSVEVTCERKLAGSGSDPTFVDQMADYTLPGGQTVHPWEAYTGAFIMAA